MAMPVPATRSTSSRSPPLFVAFPAGGAFCTTQRLVVVGRFHRPFASGRESIPVVQSGGHAGPPLHRRARRDDTLNAENDVGGIKISKWIHPCTHDAGIPFHNGRPDGETVPTTDNRCVARSVTCGPTTKDNDPEGGRTVAMPVPATRSTSSRSFPLFAPFPQVAHSAPRSGSRL